jgi:hypothetical protein
LLLLLMLLLLLPLLFLLVDSPGRQTSASDHVPPPALGLTIWKHAECTTGASQFQVRLVPASQIIMVKTFILRLWST